jgi:phospho-N-acetylmuramoyl-pentapeptide-transferase
MSYGVIMMLNILMPLLIAMAVTAVMTWRIIPALKKLNTTQNIYEDAPDTHQVKQGTPTMGGIAIIAGIIVAGAYIQITSGFDISLLVVMLVTVGFGIIGLVDDYTKVATRRNKGLTPQQQLALQIALAHAFALYIVIFGGNANESSGDFGTIVIPFAWVHINIGWFVIPYIVFILVAMTNAVNLTDGLDGLCAGTTGTVAIFYALLMFAGVIAGMLAMLNGLVESYFEPAGFFSPLYPEGFSGGVPGGADGPTSITLGATGESFRPIQFFAAVSGACFGFLLFNRHPAKIFMGDTGSLALGGAIAAAAVWSKAELMLPILGILFVLEALSVIIQVMSYRFRHGKRVFKMAPLHHHFELSGWHETKVVNRFVSFTLIICTLSLAAVVIQMVNEK